MFPGLPPRSRAARLVGPAGATPRADAPGDGAGGLRAQPRQREPRGPLDQRAGGVRAEQREPGPAHAGGGAEAPAPGIPSDAPAHFLPG